MLTNFVLEFWKQYNDSYDCFERSINSDSKEEAIKKLRELEPCAKYINIIKIEEPKSIR